MPRPDGPEIGLCPQCSRIIHLVEATGMIRAHGQWLEICEGSGQPPLPVPRIEDPPIHDRRTS
jgi:hypothetical protein